METTQYVTRGLNAGSERTELYKLCFKSLELYQKQANNFGGGVCLVLDIEKISKEINISKQKVSSWFKNNQLPGQRVKALMKLSGSTLTFNDLGPFLTSR